MTFLKKLGKIIATGLSILSGVGPLIYPFLGSGKVAENVEKGVNDLTQIGQTVIQAETLITGDELGETKLAAATPLVMSILKSSEMIAGKQIANETLFQQGASKITSGMADVLNSIHENEAKTN